MMNDGLLTTTRTEDAGTIRLRQAEAALAATQERLRRSQELGGAYPYELDFKTRTLVAAPGLGALFGLRPDEEVTYETVVARIHPEDRQRARAAHQHAMQHGGAYEQAYRVVLPDGRIRWILARGTGVRDDPGQPAGLAGITLDITRLKETEIALAKREADLAESERRFRAIADAMPQIVWSARPDGYHDYFNRRWYEFTDMDEGSTDGEGWSGMFHPEDQDRAWAAWRHSLMTGQPYEIEYRLRHHTGEYRWFLGRALPIRNERDEIERWFGTCTDIDDRKRAEAALVESEEFTRRVLASSDDCIKVLDLDANLRFMSEGGQRVMEVDDFSKIENCHWPDFWNGPAREEACRAVEVAQQGGTGRFQGFCPTARGTPKWWDVIVTSIKGLDGRPERLLSISRDITDIKQAVEARELLARELSHRIKNIFAVVGGLAALTARGNETAQPFVKAFRDRLDALARAHEYVRPHSPESHPAASGQTVQGLMRLLLAPYLQEGRERFVIRGDDVTIGPESATALALIMHEQATNALKYGALSTETGRVTLTGQRSGDMYTLTWEERNGPPVAGPPERQGFGTFMAARSITGQLGGTMNHSWAPEGLTVLVTVPVTSVLR